MANHGSKIISSIDLGTNYGGAYEICDAKAVHTLADLANLGMDTAGVFVFKGTVATINDLPKTGNQIGHVYHVTANHNEYVWAKVDGSTSAQWEEFGTHLVVSHTHNMPSVGVTGTIPEATLTNGKAAGALTKTGQTDIKMSISNVAVGANGTASVVPSYSAATGKLETTSISPAGEPVEVSKVSSSSAKLVTSSIKGVKGTTNVLKSVTVTPTTITKGSVTGVSGSVSASKANAGTAVQVAKAGSAISIPNVTGNSSVEATKITGYGTLPTWSASVDTSGVLSFQFTQGTLPTGNSVTASNTTLGTAFSVTPAVSNGSITPYTFDPVTVPVAATSATNVALLNDNLTVVKGVEIKDTDKTSVATANDNSTVVATGQVANDGTATGATIVTSVTSTDVTATAPSANPVTVATGQVKSDGTGSSVATGINPATEVTVLKGVKVTTQPKLQTDDTGVKTGEAITFGSTDLSVTGTIPSSSLTNGATNAGVTGTPN